MNDRNLIEFFVVTMTWLLLAALTLRIHHLLNELDGFDVLEGDGRGNENTFSPFS